MSLLSRYSFSVKPQEAILIVITMFWGGTFLAVQYAVTLSGYFFFVGVRFATAALAVALLSLRTLHQLTWLEFKAGVAIGIAIALGYSLQTWGLQFIPSSKSAFITAMYVPLVPLLQWLCLGRMPGLMPCIGIVLAFIGLIFLAGPGGNVLALGEGEWITLAGAVAIAAEIILISAWAGKVDVRRVTVVQLATASIVAFIAMACRRVRTVDVYRIAGCGVGAGDFQCDYPGYHELGAAQRFADARDGHLYRRAGMGRDLWSSGGGTLTAPGFARRGLHYCWRAGQ